MTEYRERAEAAEPQAATTSSEPAPLNPAAPRYMHLATAYGLPDMSFSVAGTARKQSVREEYQAYATAPLSSPATNLLKHWEVSRYLITL